MAPVILTTHAMRLGFREISGFSEADAQIIESVRGEGFDSVRDLWLRTRLKPAALEKLAEADAFRSLGLDRRDALWAVRALRLGFRQISGLSEEHARIIEQARGSGFDSVRDLWLRTRLPVAALERLANADAFGSLGLSRRDALWAVRALQRAGDKDDLPLFARAA